jgi:hypothetical protein
MPGRISVHSRRHRALKTQSQRNRKKITKIFLISFNQQIKLLSIIIMDRVSGLFVKVGAGEI